MAMGASCCGTTTKFEGISTDYKRRLWAVIAINALMFGVELTAGQLGGSQALKADALDFLGDTLTYGISLAVIGASLRVRASAALFKGASLLLMGVIVLASTIYRVFVLGMPAAQIMGVVGMLALGANLASVFILMNYRDGDANVRSVWLCSRNDAIGNLAVMVAALGVWSSATAWPDLIVAAAMACLFTWSATRIILDASREWRRSSAAIEHDPAFDRL